MHCIMKVTGRGAFINLIQIRPMGKPGFYNAAPLGSLLSAVMPNCDIATPSTTLRCPDDDYDLSILIPLYIRDILYKTLKYI